MKKVFLEAKEVKAAADGKWDSILQNLSPGLAAALAHPGRHVPCPSHGGVDGFRVFKDVAATGGGICNTCGAHRDGFALLSWANGWSFRETLEAVAREAGIKSDEDSKVRKSTPRAPRAPKVDPQVQAQQHQEALAARSRLAKVYFGSMPLDAPAAEPARAYLRNRGLTSWPPMLRMHPGLRWTSKDGEILGTFPTLISLVCDEQGRGVTLHRTYLTPDGTKAPVPEPKKLMPLPGDMSMHGASIQLCAPRGTALGIAEGLETAMAVSMATGLPCWAAVSSTLMPHWRPPNGIQKVLVFADKDRPTDLHPEGVGVEAARQLVQALQALGRRATMYVPASDIPEGAKSVDWLDEYLNTGSAAFAGAVAECR
jgi:putative DNA primase/helicase